MADDEMRTDETVVEEDLAIRTESTRMNPLDVAPGTMTVELPCGFIDGDRLHRMLIVGEMTGYEEDILAGKGPVLPRLNKIVSNCTIRLGEIESKPAIAKAVGQLTAQDRVAALLAIRRASLGDLYQVRVRCPNDECALDSRQNIDLSTVEIRGMADPMAREFEDFVGPRRTAVRWHVMNADDERWTSELKRDRREESRVTLSFLARVDEVDGVTLDRENGYVRAVSALKSLSLAERNELRSLFRKREGDVDLDVEFTCPSCRREWKATLDLHQPSFFFPSEE